MPWDSVRETPGNSDVRKAVFPAVLTINMFVLWWKKTQNLTTKSSCMLIWEEKPVWGEYNGEFVHANADNPIAWKLGLSSQPKWHLIPSQLGKSIPLLLLEEMKDDSCRCIPRRLRSGRYSIWPAPCWWLWALLSPHARKPSQHGLVHQNKENKNYCWPFLAICPIASPC